MPVARLPGRICEAPGGCAAGFAPLALFRGRRVHFYIPRLRVSLPVRREASDCSAPRLQRQRHGVAAVEDLVKTVDGRDARIPALGLGTWQLIGSSCAACIREALALGYRHVDTARMYENEDEVGRGLREAGVDREEIFLTTKLWVDELDRASVPRAVEDSLRRLGSDYVDLLLVHWPNDEVPLEETLDAMLAQRERGRVRHVGVSNFPPSWLARAAARAPIVCDQVEFHPLLAQEKLLAEARERELALVAYSPLAHGAVPRDPTLSEIGSAHGRSAAQVALRWLLQHEGVAAIPKASSRAHLEENLAVFDFQLDEEEMRRVAARNRGLRTVDPDLAPRWER